MEGEGDRLEATCMISRFPASKSQRELISFAVAPLGHKIFSSCLDQHDMSLRSNMTAVDEK
jgi:hypothetical protein